MLKAQLMNNVLLLRFRSIQPMHVVHAKLQDCQGKQGMANICSSTTHQLACINYRIPKISAVRCGSSGLGLYVLSGQLPMGVLSGQIPTPEAHTFHWGPMCPPALIAFATMRALARRGSVLVAVCCPGAAAAAARGGWWWC